MSMDKIIKDMQKETKTQPPEDLLGKIIGEIPEDIELHPSLEENPQLRRPLYRRRWWYSAAAMMLVAVGFSVSWEVYRGVSSRVRRNIIEETSNPPVVPGATVLPLKAKSAEESSASTVSGNDQVPLTPHSTKSGQSPKTPPTGVSKQEQQNASEGTKQVVASPNHERVAEEEYGEQEDRVPFRLRVVDPDGAPLPGVHVHVGSPETHTTMTGLDGTVQVELPKNGKTRVSVDLDGFKHSDVEILEKERDAGSTTIKMELGSYCDLVEVAPEGAPAYADSPAPAVGSGEITREIGLPIVDVHGIHAEGTPVSSATAPVPAGSSMPNGAPYDTVFYASSGVNPFVDTEDDQLSTFGLEVDTASYGITKRYLKDGHLPPPESIRVEEFLNSFDYGMSAPRREDFRVEIEGAPSSYSPGEHYYTLRVGIKARDVSRNSRPPAILVFCVDISGSMARENRLELVKRSLRKLLRALRPDDAVGLVVYGSTGRIVLRPVSDHERIEEAIDALQPGGSTNAGEGLQLAYRLLHENGDGKEDGRIRRVILCSDGVANTGITTSGGILDLVRHERDEGIELTTVGFGMGNYNDVLMEKLADAGNGRYAYVDDLEEAQKVFVTQLEGTLMSIAFDAKAQVEFDPDVVLRWRLVGYENRDIEDHRFRDPTVDAGEIGPGHTVTALYQVKLRPRISRRDTVAVVRLRYRPAESAREVEIKERLRVKNLAPTWRDASDAFKLATQVAAFAEVLRHSYWSREMTLGQIKANLDGLEGSLGQSAEVLRLRRLVEKALMLSQNNDR